MSTTSDDRSTIDWATEFDHTDPAYNEHAHAIWERPAPAVSGGPHRPVRRHLAAVRHADVSAIAHDTENYTSQGVVVSPHKPEAAGRGGAPPITSDPPVHAEARRLLLPPFAPKVIEGWEDTTRTCAGT